MKKLGSFLFLIALAATVFVVRPVAQASAHDRVAGELIVRLKPGVDRSQVSQTLGSAGADVVSSSGKLKSLVIKVDPTKVDAIQAKLTKLGASAEPNYLIHANFVPNDPNFSSQWALNNTGQTIFRRPGKAGADIKAEAAWDVTKGDGEKVAILDSGIDQNHPDLSGKVTDQNNFTDSPTVDDEFGHGTHVAGIVAADTDNATGVAGVCPNCALMNVKVLNDQGEGEYSWVAAGIVWAADHGAKVINLSLGAPYPSSDLEAAVNYAWSKGVVIVAAAGNSYGTRPNYPAAYSNVVAVAATDNRDFRAYFSSYSRRWVEVAAPGVNVLSTLPTHETYLSDLGYTEGYDFLSGTSMASPMAAGVAALIWSTPHGTSNADVVSRLESTADRIHGTGIYWSAGRINAARAVAP